jgi:hypothetical protein
VAPTGVDIDGAIGTSATPMTPINATDAKARIPGMIAPGYGASSAARQVP